MPAKLKKKHTFCMDPECGKSVDTSKALKLLWEGKTYFFCSETCRKRFEEDPPGDASF